MTPETKPKCDIDPVCGIDLTAEHGKFAYDFEVTVQAASSSKALMGKSEGAI
jgi:hypothetical protein